MTARYGTDWKEEVAADEEVRFAALAEEIVAIQRGRDATHHEKGRGLHRKAIGAFAATFTVRDDLADVLPPELHVGPFTPGARHEAFVRLSNGSWARAHDKEPDVRGVAIKLLGVGGTKVLTGAEEPRTQDFLLIHTPTSGDSPDDFVKVVKVLAAGSQATLLPRMVWALGPVGAWQALSRLARMVRRPFANYPGAAYFSASTYRFGPTAARFALAPLADHPPIAPGGRDFYADHVRETLRDGFGWSFQVQLYQDEARTPVERAGVEWRAEDSPYLTIAKVEVAPCDPDAPEARATAERVEALSFDPWHAVEALRPLGAVNRARKAAYFASTKSRGAAPEPT